MIHNESIATRNANKFRDLIDAWSTNDIERLVGHFSDDLVYVDVPFSESPVRGKDHFRRHMLEYNSQFDFSEPMKVEFLAVVANETHAVGELQVVARYVGEGAPLGGVTVSWFVTLIDTIVDGKVVTERVYFDPQAIAQQVHKTG